MRPMRSPSFGCSGGVKGAKVQDGGLGNGVGAIGLSKNIGDGVVGPLLVLVLSVDEDKDDDEIFSLSVS